MAIVPHDGIDGKVCVICGEWKPLTGFKGNGNRCDGHDHKCRTCRAYRRVKSEVRDGAAGKECTCCKTWKAYSEFSPGHLSDGYYGHCKACVAEKSSRYYNANPKGWYERVDPERWRQYSRNRRARKVASVNSFTVAEWRKLKAQYNNTCLCCGRSEPEILLTPDHVIPLSKGGSNGIENIQPLCIRCNLSKYTKSTDYR